MISIILLCSDETKEKAIAAGFREQTVLVRQEIVQSLPENKRRIEQDVKTLHPFQFLVSDYWGMEPD